MADNVTQPSDFELQILGVLWGHGPSTVRQVMELLPDRKERAYTSVLSVMQVMEKKGLLAKTPAKEGLANVYKAKVARKKVLGPLLRGLVTRVFQGSPSAAVQQLLSESSVSDEELAEIRRLIDEIQRKRKP